jgi:lipoate-protein ligase B
MRESHEWAYNVIYNEIGNNYDGYKTTDEKIASSLVFELVRSNTLHGLRFNIFSDLDKVNNQMVFMVWVKTNKVSE